MNQQIILADYKDDLTPFKRERGKYYCPACGGHNLSFFRTGAWNCWNDPSRQHRLEILAAVVPNFQGFSQRVIPVSPPIIPPPVDLKLLYFAAIEDEHLSEIVGNCTTYWYSNRQKITRLDYPNRKVIFPESFDGKHWQKSAGNLAWKPYGLSRLFPNSGKVNLVLIVEGQKGVEIAHSRGIPALCLEGGDYADRTTVDKLRMIRDKLQRLLIVILPDRDRSGSHKAAQILRVANSLAIPALLLNPLEIEANLEMGDDIEQITSLDRDRLMTIVKQKISAPF